MPTIKEIARYGSGVRGIFKIDDATGEIVFTEKAKPVEVNAPAIHQDTCEPFMSMTGSDRIHESKSSYRKELKEMGFVEVGEKPKFERPLDSFKYKSDINDIRDTVARVANGLKYGNIPMTEEEKHLNEMEIRECKAARKRELAQVRAATR